MLCCVGSKELIKQLMKFHNGKQEHNHGTKSGREMNESADIIK
jgi:hypothetical protein